MAGLGEGFPYCSCYGYLGAGVSNNVAEYQGLLACMERAAREENETVIFQVDSSLVANQMAHHGAWACRSLDLLPLRDACRQVVRSLNAANVSWSVHHIYREYNQAADALAKGAVDEKVAYAPSAHW